MARCDNCGKPTDADPNFRGEVLCSDDCQSEYGLTDLLSLMTAPTSKVPKGTKIRCFDPKTGNTITVEA